MDNETSHRGGRCNAVRVTATPYLNPGLLSKAATQRGVFTSAQAYDAGHTQKEIQRLRADKHLVSLRRGVYVLRDQLSGAQPTERHRMQVSALSMVLTAPAVFSHETAAAEHGLDLLDPDFSVLHATRGENNGARDEAAVRHHAAELPEHHVVRRVGEPDLTSPARTAIDVARRATRYECAVAVIDSALRCGVRPDELYEVMDRCRSWPGARMASRAFSIADGRAANPGESWSRVILIQQGVPPLDLQVPVFDEGGLVGYADFGWGDVLGELDGRGKYGIGVDTDPEEAGRIVWREKRREDRMRAQGKGVVRWTYADHYRPATIGVQVKRALARVADGRRRTG